MTHIWSQYFWNVLATVLAIAYVGCGDGLTPLGISAPGVLAEPGEDGAACDRFEDCLSGTCLTESDTSYPGGYCTTFVCADSGCNGGVCIQTDQNVAQCLDTCTSNEDCRPEYACLQQTGTWVCDLAEPVAIDLTPSADGQCLSGCGEADSVRIECGFSATRVVQAATSEWLIPFETTENPEGIALSVWPEWGGHQINVVAAYNHSEEVIHLKSVDSALNISSFYDNDFVTTTLPFAPSYADFLEQREYLLRVQSTAETLCLSRAQGPEGESIDLHFYFVGADGLTADSAESDPDFAAMLTEVERLFELASIQVDDVLTTDADPETVDAFRIVRSSEELRDLLQATFEPTDSDGQENGLVMNLVLIDDYLPEDGTDTVGQAALLPGPPGLHGTRYSGVVVETSSFRANPAQLALAIVHETGHFLGLRHTSEVFTTNVVFGRTDPLDDTPVCDDIYAQLEQCPDYYNLMFPLTPTDRSMQSVELSHDQGWVLRRNPLVR